MSAYSSLFHLNCGGRVRGGFCTSCSTPVPEADQVDVDRVRDIRRHRRVGRRQRDGALVSPVSPRHDFGVFVEQSIVSSARVAFLPLSQYPTYGIPLIDPKTRRLYRLARLLRNGGFWRSAGWYPRHGVR